MATVAAFTQSLRWDSEDPREVRRQIRIGEYAGQTGALAAGYVQANLAILPVDFADDFMRFCQRNPKPCPLLAVSEPGSALLPELAADLDIRTDVSSYRVFRNGERVEDVSDIRSLWQDDFVVFALGCSFSFEEPMIEAGLRIPHWEDGSIVPMYLTNIDCVPAGRFQGKLVTSMRAFTPADAIKAIQITSRYPKVHGAPVHIGLPAFIGVEDISKAWQGDDPQCRE